MAAGWRSTAASANSPNSQSTCRAPARRGLRAWFEMNCIGGDELPPEIRPKSPSPPFWGEREGPTPEAWEGEVGGAADQDIGPPHPALSPRPAGGEGNASGYGRFELSRTRQ